MHNSSRERFVLLFVLVALVIVALSVSPSGLGARVLLNLAQLQRIHDEDVNMLLQSAVELAPADEHIRWQAGRVAVQSGQSDKGAQLLEPLIDSSPQDPSIFADALQAFSDSGRYDMVIDLFKTNLQPMHSAVISDIVALAYMERGEFKESLAFRPNDLFALYSLLEHSRQENAMANDVGLNLNERLAYFSEDSIQPANRRLAELAGEVMIKLRHENLWSKETTYGVIAALIWKYPNFSGIAEKTIEHLHQMYPDEMEWQQLKLELNRRYRLTMHSNPTGIEQGASRLMQSTRSNMLNPDIPIKSAFWQWDAFYGRGNNKALFLGGPDFFESDSAVRLSSLWQRPVDEGTAPPYSEFTSRNITLESNSKYRLSVRYKTSMVGNPTAFVALLDYVSKPKFMFVHTGLPPTHGKWQTWSVTGMSYSEPIDTQIILRMLGTGSVWFDNVELVKVTK